jgi:hypothetical protein
MCDKHRMHVTVIKRVARCTLCGHRLFPVKIKIWDWPGELLDRYRARQALWNQPALLCGVLFY